MKLVVAKQKLGNSPDQFLRRAGFAFIRDRQTGQSSYVKRLTREFYPRLHLYLEEEGDRVVFNMHLDQKKASYAGQGRHSAEYDHPLVQQELDNLNLLTKDSLDSYHRDGEEKKEKGLFKRIFS